MPLPALISNVFFYKDISDKDKELFPFKNSKIERALSFLFAFHTRTNGKNKCKSYQQEDI